MRLAVDKFPCAVCLLPIVWGDGARPTEAEQAGQQCEGVWFRNNHQIASGLRECVGFPAHVEVFVNSAGPGAGAMLGEKGGSTDSARAKSTDTGRGNISNIPDFMRIFLKINNF